MGRRNALITVALLGAAALAGFVFAAAASGDANDLDADLGPAVVADVGATTEDPDTTATATAAPSVGPEVRKVTPPKPKKVGDDDDDEGEDEDREDGDREDGDDEEDDDDDE